MSQKIKLVINRIFLISFLLFGTVGCDQVTKTVARDTLRFSGPLSYFNGALQITQAQNPGAFLSMGADFSRSTRFWVFTFAVAVFLLYATWILIRSKPRLRVSTTIGLALICGGGFGNLIDRIAFGSVTDFLNLGFGSVRTGIFNIADVAIVTGVMILAVGSTSPARATLTEELKRN